MSGDPRQSPEYLLVLRRAQEQDATKTLAAASFAIVIYDMILTLPDEKRHIWDTKPALTFAKALFYINRWYTPIPLFVNLCTQFSRKPSASLCKLSGQYVSFSGVLTFAVVEAVLMLRVWALYDRGRIMGRWLGAALFITVTLYLVFLSIALPNIKSSHISLLPGVITGCAQDAPTIYFAIFGTTVVLETVLFGMTLYKVFSHSRANIKLPVIHHVLASGCLYFFAIFLSFAFTIVGHFLPEARPDIQLPGANSCVVLAVCTTACSRLLLSIRDLYAPPAESPTFQIEVTTETYSARHGRQNTEEIELQDQGKDSVGHFQGYGVNDEDDVRGTYISVVGRPEISIKFP